MCPDKKILSALLDDQLSLYGREAIESHLKHCSSCREVYQEMEKTREILKDVDQPWDPQRLQDMKEAIVSGRKHGAPSKPFWQRQITWTAAAGWALLFGLGALLAGRTLGDQTNGAPMVDIHQINDSSQFTLDTKSTPELIFTEDLASETVVDLKDATVSYLGESELVHYVNFEGGQ